MKDEELINVIKAEYEPPSLTNAEANAFDARLTGRVARREAQRMQNPRPRLWVAAAAVACALVFAVVFAGVDRTPAEQPEPIDWLKAELIADDEEIEFDLPDDYASLAILITPLEEEEEI